VTDGRTLRWHDDEQGPHKLALGHHPVGDFFLFLDTDPSLD